MIDVGTFRAHNCRRVSRRAFVHASLSLPLVGALANPAAAAGRSARSVILLWLWGGPSHLDTFDPKPRAPVEIRGPFAPIATRTGGLQISELFPRLAACSPLYSVVRSHINLNNAHDIAGSIALSGGVGENSANGYGPNFGSVVQRVSGRLGALPSFVSIAPGKLNTAAGDLKAVGGGVWGPAYDPFYVRCDDRGQVGLPGLRLLDGLSVERLADRKTLRQSIDRIARQADAHAAGLQWQRAKQQAYRLLTSPDGRRAFDLSNEPPEVRGRYGRTLFGQSCLLARRLAEAEVPYIQVNWSEWVENIYDNRTDFGWDTHWLNFEHLTDRHGPILDRALSALLSDLDARGLLDQTLVVALGEFGRTPKVSGNGGRDHWERCYSSLWAGGGVVPGRIVGESDRRAYDPVTTPVTPSMVGTTLLHLAGIDSQQRARLRVLPEGRLIEGLL